MPQGLTAAEICMAGWLAGGRHICVFIVLTEKGKAIQYNVHARRGAGVKKRFLGEMVDHTAVGLHLQYVQSATYMRAHEKGQNQYCCIVSHAGFLDSRIVVLN